jgi:hypothetical protein
MITATNNRFCNIGAEAIPFSPEVSGFAIVLRLGQKFFNVVPKAFGILIFIFSISIGLRFQAEDFQIPQHRQALPLAKGTLLNKQ